MVRHRIFSIPIDYDPMDPARTVKVIESFPDGTWIQYANFDVLKLLIKNLEKNPSVKNLDIEI